MKRLWIVALILIASSGGSLAAPTWSAPPSEQPGLSMQAEAAFDGYFKYGEWLPVWVQLENNGRDLEAEVRVRVTGSWGATTFAAPAPLPAGSRKRIPVYVLPNNFSHVLEVELVADDEVLLAQEIPVKSQPNINYLVGLIAPARGALSFITGASLPGQERPKTLIDLSLADLPERPEGLRSFDTLILDDTDTSSLTPEQKLTLETWVRQGGRLVIGGGAGATRTTIGLPDSILPFAPRGEVEVERLPGLADFAGAEPIRVPGPFVVATGDEAKGRTLAAQDGLPLVRERAIGAGFVNFVTLDLTASPFDAWTGTAAFWERLLSPGAAYPEWLPPDVSARQMKSGQMTYALSRLPALDLPSIRGLGLLLILYVVLVGPVNYIVLRWQKRLHWAWASVPLITLVFSAGAFGVGYTLRGTDLILNKIAVIELGADGAANVTSYLGLFSPARQSYEIEVRDGGLLSPLTPDYNPWGPSSIGTAGEIVFVQGEPSRVRGLAVNQWSMQTLLTEGTWADFGHIGADLQIEEGEALVGTVRNETTLILKDTSLVLGNHFVRLGDLRPSQEALVTMELLGIADQDFGQPLSFLLFEDQLTPSGPGDPPRETELKQRAVESVFEQGGRFGPVPSRVSFGGGGSSRQRLVFIGWLDEAPPEVRVAGRKPRQQTTALLYAPVSFRLPVEGDVSLPPGLLPGALVAMPIEGGPCGPNSASFWLGRGEEAIFEFQLPEEIQDLRVNELKLVIGTVEGGWWQAPETAVYDWDSDVWVALDEPIIGVNIISDATSRVSEDGLVQARLSSESNQGGCLYLELGLEGTR
jgi:hypothetical protein